MAQGRARAFLKQKGIEDYNELMDQWEDLQTSNVSAQTGEAWGSLIGKWGLPLLGSLLTGGLPVWGAMLDAVAGDYLGGELGERHQGGLDFGGPGVQGSEAITPVGTRSDVRREIGEKADTAYGGFEEGQQMDALTSTLLAYPIAGGGKFTGFPSMKSELTKPAEFSPASLYSIFNPKS